MSRVGKRNLEIDHVDWSEKARDVSRIPFASAKGRSNIVGKGWRKIFRILPGGRAI